MTVAFGTLLSDSTNWGAIEIGTVLLWGGLYNAIPSGFLICDGAAVSDTTYADLLSIIGTRYGAGGAGTFNVPNMIDRFPRGATTNASGGTAGGTCYHSHSVNGTTGNCGIHDHCIKSQTCCCYLSASSFYKNGAYRAACCGRHCHCIKTSTCCAGGHYHTFSGTYGCNLQPPFVEFVFIIKI